MLRKILRKSQPDFWYYVKKIEAQAKKWFFCKKKRVHKKKEILTEAVSRRCFVKKVFLKISQNS